MVSSKVNKPKIVMLSELFRHGSRYTMYNLFNDPFITKNQQQLDPTGMHQEYMLGKGVKNDYSPFLPESYNPNEISVISSDTRRTIESATSHMLGMFDLESGETLKTLRFDLINPPYILNKVATIPGLDYALPNGFRPIPVKVEDAKTGPIFIQNLTGTCPKLAKKMQEKINQVTPIINQEILSTSDKLKSKNFNSMKIFGHENFEISDMNKVGD